MYNMVSKNNTSTSFVTNLKRYASFENFDHFEGESRALCFHHKRSVTRLTREMLDIARDGALEVRQNSV